MTAGRPAASKRARAAKAPVASKREKKAPAEPQAMQPIGAEPIAEPEPKLAGRAVYGLKGRGLELWNIWAPRLRAARMMRQTDEIAFARYCRDLAKFEQLRNTLDRAGETYITDTAHGRMRRIDPRFQVADRLARHLLAMEDRFGLNPAERQRQLLQRANAGAGGGKAGDLFGDNNRPPVEPADPSEPASPATPDHDLETDDDFGPIGFLAAIH